MPVFLYIGGMNPPALASSSATVGAYWPQKESVPKSAAFPVANIVADFWPATAANVHSAQDAVKIRDSTAADVDLEAMSDILRPAAWLYVASVNRVFQIDRIWQPDPKFICATLIDGLFPLTQAEVAYTGVTIRTIQPALRYAIKVDAAGPTIEGQPVANSAFGYETLDPLWQSRPTCYDATAGGSVSISIKL